MSEKEVKIIKGLLRDHSQNSHDKSSGRQHWITACDWRVYGFGQYEVKTSRGSVPEELRKSLSKKQSWWNELFTTAQLVSQDLKRFTGGWGVWWGSDRFGVYVGGLAWLFGALEGKENSEFKLQNHYLASLDVRNVIKINNKNISLRFCFPYLARLINHPLQ